MHYLLHVMITFILLETFLYAMLNHKIIVHLLNNSGCQFLKNPFKGMSVYFNTHGQSNHWLQMWLMIKIISRIKIYPATGSKLFLNVLVIIMSSTDYTAGKHQATIDIWCVKKPRHSIPYHVKLKMLKMFVFFCQILQSECRSDAKT